MTSRAGSELSDVVRVDLQQLSRSVITPEHRKRARGYFASSTAAFFASLVLVILTLITTLVCSGLLGMVDSLSAGYAQEPAVGQGGGMLAVACLALNLVPMGMLTFISIRAILRLQGSPSGKVDDAVAEIAAALERRAKEIASISKEVRTSSRLTFEPFFLASPVWGGTLGPAPVELLPGNNDFQALANPINRLDDISILMTRMLGQRGILRSSMTQIQWLFITENALVVARFYVDLWYGRIVREEVREILYSQVSDARSSTTQWRVPPLLPLWFQIFMRLFAPLRAFLWIFNAIFVAHRSPVLQSQVLVRLTSGYNLDISYDAYVSRYWNGKTVGGYSDATELLEKIREDLLRHSVPMSEAMAANA